jgi:isoleucyl-tRNA synthetase
LQTPTGPKNVTIDGAETCLVTSGTADDVRRLVLLPLWNSYAFFVNYARLDEFDPTLPLVPVSERPEIDRWILSNLQALITALRQALENFDSPAACAGAAAFIDDLSNWYIRRNRRRFWRSRSEAEGSGPRAEGQKSVSSSVPQPSALSPQPAWERDKLAAYQTLYDVLLTLTKLLAPLIPFVTERMYHNLTAKETQGWLSLGFQESVHLCAYPVADAALLDAELNQRMSLAQLVVKLGHKLRDAADQRVRQPLPELRFACADSAQREAITKLSDVIADELNVKQITPCDSLGDIVKYVYKANLKTLGPKYGKLLNLIKTQLPTLAASRFAPLQNGQAIAVTLDGQEIRLEPEDVIVSTEQAAEWHTADERGVQVALSSHLTPELIREGMARDFVRHVQQARKDADLEIEQRIRIAYATDDAEAIAAVTAWAEYIRNETLADELTQSPGIADSVKAVSVGNAPVRVAIVPV